MFPKKKKLDYPEFFCEGQKCVSNGVQMLNVCFEDWLWLTCYKTLECYNDHMGTWCKLTTGVEIIGKGRWCRDFLSELRIRKSVSYSACWFIPTQETGFLTRKEKEHPPHGFPSSRPHGCMRMEEEKMFISGRKKKNKRHPDYLIIGRQVFTAATSVSL